MAKILLFDLNLDRIFERIVKIIGLKLFNERIKWFNERIKRWRCVHNQTWKSASENSLVFIISQDQLAESCNITFSFYFGGNAWLMILNFYLSPGTFNIRGFIFQWIKSLVGGQYVVCNITCINLNVSVHIITTGSLSPFWWWHYSWCRHQYSACMTKNWEILTNTFP